MVNYIKKLVKCYFKRIPDVLLIVFAFGISLSVEGRINIVDFYTSVLMYILVLLLTAPIAVLDYAIDWYIKTNLEE